MLLNYYFCNKCGFREYMFPLLCSSSQDYCPVCNNKLYVQKGITTLTYNDFLSHKDTRCAIAKCVCCGRSIPLIIGSGRLWEKMLEENDG